jgi:hypothetical protein
MWSVCISSMVFDISASFQYMLQAYVKKTELKICVLFICFPTNLERIL